MPPPRHLLVGLFAGLAWLGARAAVAPATPESGEPPLTKAIQIRSLTSEEALRGLPVRIRGTVIFIAAQQDVFVQDDTAGTFFRTDRAAGLKPGDVIEVEGKTHAGLYLPGIGPSPYRVVGYGPLPEAVRVSAEDLRSGRFHYQRVAAEGVVRAGRRLPDGRMALKVGATSPWIEVRVESGTGPGLASFVGAEIRAEGLAAGSINPRRQLVQPYVQLRDWTDITIVRPALPAADLPKVSATELLTFRVARSADSRVRVGGIVTAQLPGGLICLREGATAFAVRLSEPADVAAGDRLEVVGFPEIERFSATVMDAVLLSRTAGSRPDAVPVSLPGLLEGLHDHDLVAVQAVVTDTFRSEDGWVLTLQDSGEAVQVYTTSKEPPAAVGSIVRVTAICVVEASGGPRYSAHASAVTLRAVQADDIAVIETPSWWTPRRLGAVLAVLGAAVLLAGLWITLLRRQVMRQTAALRERIESEAALQERQRIAREFHDTLEQDLAGLALRLDAAATRDMDAKGRGLLVTARSLVTRIQIETRNLIADLRNSAESAGDLGGALHDVVAAHGGKVTLIGVDGLPSFPAAVVHHVRMIVGEGVANALKHAEANHIEVRVEYADGTLRIEVADDGRGFDAAAETSGKSGHFGCVGIRERALKIGATVGWTSHPGKGTRLVIEVPPSDAGHSYLPSNAGPAAVV